MGGKSATGMQHQHRATLAETLYGGAFGRSFQSSSWQDSQPTERQARSSDFGCGPTETQGWLDALEYSEVGGRTWHQHTRVARVLAKAGLQPHRLRRYMASDDPDFETKAADIIGLYLKPPVNAAVFCVDEKSAIQALDRLDPVLPLSPGRAERHGFEYYRHGTLSLYAALNTKTGQVLGQTAPRHTSAEFVAFLEQIVASLPQGQQIHIIADNLSAHRTSRVWQFIDRHRAVRIHFTPTYSSWLNQVEIWFSKIQRDVIARGIFRSVKDLAKKLMTYIRRYNIKAKPFKWTYRSAGRRINPVSGLNATPH